MVLAQGVRADHGELEVPEYAVVHDPLLVDGATGCLLVEVEQLVRLSRRIADELPKTRTTTYKNRVVAVLSFDPLDRAGTQCLDRLVEGLGDEGLTAGLSFDFSGFSAFERAYQQARRAIMVGKLLNERRTLYDYGRYQLFEFVDDARQCLDVASYCNPVLARMAALDAEDGTKYVETLREYLTNMCNANRTAKAMRLHKNTVLYRVGRIRELFGIDFDDALLMQNLLLTLAIEQVEGIQD